MLRPWMPPPPQSDPPPEPVRPRPCWAAVVLCVKHSVTDADPGRPEAVRKRRSPPRRAGSKVLPFDAASAGGGAGAVDAEVRRRVVGGAVGDADALEALRLLQLDGDGVT